MKIVWVSNAHIQATGYGRLCRHIVRYVHDHSDHQMVEFAISGLLHTEPMDWDGVKVYGIGKDAGQFGVSGWAGVQAREQPDLWMINFDAWHPAAHGITKVGVPYAIYPPVDHDPLPPQWLPVLRGALDIVPYCAFGERVIREGLGIVAPMSAPIYHGVDTEVFAPREVSRAEAFGADEHGNPRIPEDAFVVGVFKNNQGTRAKMEINLEAFRRFLDETGETNAYLYCHCARTGQAAFDIADLVARYRLSGKVVLPNKTLYDLGFSHEEMSTLINACDVVLNSNAGEGFGLPIIEAFACGKPVIGTAFTSMPELILGEEGEIKKASIGPEVIDCPRGWLVPTSDTEWTPGKRSTRRVFLAADAAAALVTAYKDREAIAAKGAAARDWVQQFSWDAIGQQWVEYFDGLEGLVAARKINWQGMKAGPLHREQVAGVGVVLAYNRPDYLARTLDSLVRANGSDDADWLLLQDGWRNNPELPYTTPAGEAAIKEQVENSARVLNGAPFAHKEVHLTPDGRNRCVAAQFATAMDLAFDSHAYDYAMVFNDDHEVSRHYLELLLALHKQFPGAIVGAQATEARNVGPEARLDQVGVTFRQVPDNQARAGRWRYIGYLIPRDVWEKVRERMGEYFAWVGENQRNLPRAATLLKFGLQALGYDGMMDRVCDDLGIPRVATVVPRGRYIGRVGMFGTPQLYAQQGWSDRWVYEFEDDPVREFSARAVYGAPAAPQGGGHVQAQGGDASGGN